jgi:hypothetical protein
MSHSVSTRCQSPVPTRRDDGAEELANFMSDRAADGDLIAGDRVIAAHGADPNRPFEHDSRSGAGRDLQERCHAEDDERRLDRSADPGPADNDDPCRPAVLGQ